MARNLSSSTSPPDALPGTRRVHINLPAYLVTDMQERALRQGTTVTEIIRRAVSLEILLLGDPETEVVLRNRTTQQEKVLTIIS